MERKEYYLKQQIEIAKKAVERYSRGELTPLEIHLGCDAKKITLGWNETLLRLQDKLNSYRPASF